MKLADIEVGKVYAHTSKPDRDHTLGDKVKVIDANPIFAETFDQEVVTEATRQPGQYISHTHEKYNRILVEVVPQFDHQQGRRMAVRPRDLVDLWDDHERWVESVRKEDQEKYEAKSKQDNAERKARTQISTRLKKLGIEDGWHEGWRDGDAGRFDFEALLVLLDLAEGKKSKGK